MATMAPLEASENCVETTGHARQIERTLTKEASSLPALKISLYESILRQLEDDG